jgi:hypothetical protein
MKKRISTGAIVKNAKTQGNRTPLGIKFGTINLYHNQ